MSRKTLRYYGNGHFCVPRTVEHQGFCTESSRGTVKILRHGDRVSAGEAELSETVIHKV